MQHPPQTFNRELYLSRQAKARGDGIALLDQRISDELADRLAVINHRFEIAMLIAPRPTDLIRILTMTGKFDRIESRLPMATDDLALRPQSHNAIFSILDLHTVNDVPGYMAQVANALKPDGLALFCFFAGDTLRELRDAWLVAEQELTGGASPRVAPMIDLRQAGGLLQRAGLALPVADTDRLTLGYADAIALMREIKNLGMSNCMIGRRWSVTSQRLLLKSAEIYQRDFGKPDGRITACLEIAWALAWKPHPSQQQPLKPGSAKARLADALKAD